MFNAGEDVLQYEECFERDGLKQRRVGVDMPISIIDRLDARASAYGVTRQALIKTWLAERLDLEDRLDLLARAGAAPLGARTAPAPKAQPSAGEKDDLTEG